MNYIRYRYSDLKGDIKCYVKIQISFFIRIPLNDFSKQSFEKSNLYLINHIEDFNLLKSRLDKYRSVSIKLNKDNLKLCYMDTDSFVYHIKTEDFYKDIADDVQKVEEISEDVKSGHPVSTEDFRAGCRV